MPVNVGDTAGSQKCNSLEDGEGLSKISAKTSSRTQWPLWRLLQVPGHADLYANFQEKQQHFQSSTF